MPTMPTMLVVALFFLLFALVLGVPRAMSRGRPDQATARAAADPELAGLMDDLAALDPAQSAARRASSR